MPSLTFVYLPTFERTAKGLLSADDERALELVLLTNPDAGDVMARTGGWRKLRVARQGAGKRGGYRVIYYFVRSRSRIYFALLYAKNVASDLTEAEKRFLQQAAAALG